MKILVDGRVRVPLSECPEAAADAIRAAATHVNPNHGKARHQNEPPTYRTWEHDAEGYLTVPRGMLAKVEELLGRNPGSVLDDLRTWRHPEPDFPDLKRPLWSHQRDLIESGIVHDHGLWKAGTGSGKTSAAFGYLARLKRRALVMVCSEALLAQWRERAVLELGMEIDEVGHVQGNRERIRPLTLAMQQTVAARFAKGAGELADAFDVFFFDEVQRAPADTAQAAIGPFRAKKRIGASADYTRHDQMEFITRDLFGSLICEIADNTILASGSVVEVEVACVPTRFHAPPAYFVNRDFHALLDAMTVDDARNAQILSLVRSAVSSGEQVLVFTHRVEHARYLDGQIAKLGMPGGLMLGEDKPEFRRTKMRIEAKQIWAAVGTYNAIGEGIDLPSVARGIAATPIHNNRQRLNQVKGRLCRSADGKAFGRLAVMFDPGVYQSKPVANFCQWFSIVKVWSESERRWVTGKDWLAKRRAA